MKAKKRRKPAHQATLALTRAIRKLTHAQQINTAKLNELLASEKQRVHWK